MEETSKKREAYWNRWVAYALPLGVDPYLQKTAYAHKVRALSGFAARVRSGAFGRRREGSAKHRGFWQRSEGRCLLGCFGAARKQNQGNLYPPRLAA